MSDLEQMAVERLKAASDMSLMAYQQPSESKTSCKPDYRLDRQAWRNLWKRRKHESSDSL